MHNRVDIAVIGAGMAGAATAWALAQRGASVVLIGPGEPAEVAGHRGVFASHYDEGRITRIADRDPVWAELAARSIARYRVLEELSGVKFHTPSRLLMLGPRDGSFLTETATVTRRCGGVTERLTADDVAKRFQALTCPQDRAGLLEAMPAGHVNPRRLVQALIMASLQSGGRHIDAAVCAVERRPDGLQLMLENGGPVSASRAVLATGAFTLEPRLSAALPWLCVEGRTVVMFEVAEDDRQTLALPSLIHEIGTPDAHETLYAVPPVRYPDGSLYLKAGTGLKPSVLATSNDAESGQIGDWFRGGGNVDEIACIKAETVRLIPHLASARTKTATCALTNTKSGYPYIAMLDDRLGMVLGCNGVAAKSCIAIGEHAADMLDNKLSEEHAETFAALN